MPNGMRSRRQLGKEENGNEKEMAQRIHNVSLVDLNEQAFEIFAFRKIQGNRVVSGTGQTADNACRTAGIMRRIGDDFLEQFQPDAPGAGVSHQHSTRLEQAETEQIDVFVSPRRTFCM